VQTYRALLVRGVLADLSIILECMMHLRTQLQQLRFRTRRMDFASGCQLTEHMTYISDFVTDDACKNANLVRWGAPRQAILLPSRPYTYERDSGGQEKSRTELGQLLELLRQDVREAHRDATTHELLPSSSSWRDDAKNSPVGGDLGEEAKVI
jgi:hypothetical protein